MTSESVSKAGIKVVSLKGLPSVVIQNPKGLGANGKALADAVMDAISSEMPTCVHKNAVR